MRNDDGRRNMPKMRCPFCHARLLDVSDVQLKNQSELKPLIFADHPDYILKCPECKKDLALLIKRLHERRAENKTYPDSRKYIHPKTMTVQGVASQIIKDII